MGRPPTRVPKKMTTRLFTVPLFFHEIVEIERVLPLMAAILIFKGTERQVRLKIAVINGETRSI